MTSPDDDPFAATNESDVDDPFASADDAKSNAGPFVPWPNVADLQGRLLVLVPRKYEEEAKVSQYLQDTHNIPPTRNEWTTDLIVLKGPLPWKYKYMARDEQDKEKYTEKEHTVESYPFYVPNWKVVWGNVIGALNAVTQTPRPMALGYLKAGYPIGEMRKGKTFDQFASELEAFYASPKGKKQPKPVWHFVVSEDAGDRKLAQDWWKTAREEGFKLP